MREQGRSGVLSFEGCQDSEGRGNRKKRSKGGPYRVGWGGVMPARDLACGRLSLSMIMTEGSRSQEGEKGGVGGDTVNHGRREGASTGKEGRAEPHKGGIDSREQDKELGRRCRGAPQTMLRSPPAWQGCLGD